MSLTFDEYGRPYIIVREQGAKSRLKGLEAQKVRVGLPSGPARCSQLLPVACRCEVLTCTGGAPRSLTGQHFGCPHRHELAANVSWP